MRSTFLGFETARRGIAANQKGLDITGQNMTNVNTEGYTRQRLDLVSLSGSSRDRFRSIGVSNVGQGVLTTGVSQIRNEFLDARFRNENAHTSYFDSALSILNSTETVLNEISSGFKPLISGLVTALHGFAQFPDQTTQANVVKTSTKSFVDMLNHVSSQLSQVKNQYETDLKVEVNDLNQQLIGIKNLNESISNLMMHDPQAINTTVVNELLDQRNVAVDNLSKFFNISVKNESDSTITISVNDHIVVSKETTEQINMFSHEDGSVQLRWQTNGNPMLMTSGSMKANLDYINGQSGDIKGIPYYQKQIDVLAQTFASTMNQAFSNSDSTKKTLIEFDASSPASTMKLSAQFDLNPRYIISDGVGSNNLDNTAIHQLIQALEQDQDFNGFTGSFSDHIEQYVVTLAQDISFYESRLNVSIAIVHDIQQHRDSISGVSLDEEGAELMKYEKAYKAIARLMTTMDEAIDIIINRTGLVGR